ncbi:hypothetical protein ACFVAV_32865 [Nocardia sp. NPDC057663]|uniref:hypothetical protein n=1 Tax=Nocardia sp. NPDC057663 TaxID=3346201 RepID=UPI00366C391B
MTTSTSTRPQAIEPMVDVHSESLRQWILKAQASPGKPATGAKTAEQLELEQLRRENREL